MIEKSESENEGNGRQSETTRKTVVRSYLINGNNSSSNPNTDEGLIYPTLSDF